MGKIKGVLVRAFWALVAVSSIYLVYLVVSLSFGWFSSLFVGVNDTVKATSITAFVTVLTFVVGRLWEQSRERKLRINAEKIEVYKRFVDFYFDMFSYEKINGQPKPQSQVMKEMLDFQRELVFWGSDSVMRSYLDFKDELTAFGGQNGALTQHESVARVFLASSKLLVAMRRDIGYSFTSIGAKDLARLQLSTDQDTRKIIDFLK